MNNIKRVLSSFISVSIMSQFCFSIPVSADIIMQEMIIIQPENKISDDLTVAMASDADSIPVVIWLDDIDNTEVEEKIKASIGYDINSLSVEYAAPSEDLINELAEAANGNPTEYLELLMDNHMKLTESERAEEKEKTEQYLTARRDIVQQMNVNESTCALESLDISSEKVGFISNFAPMVVCNLTPDEIVAASENNKVQEITKYEPLDIEECAVNFGTTKSTMRIDKINDSLGLTGEGVVIGIYEPDTVSSRYTAGWEIDDSRVTVIGTELVTSDHPTYCAAIAAGNNGVAPKAEIYSASSVDDWNSFNNDYVNGAIPNLEKLIDEGADIVNMSWGAYNDIDCYTNWTKYMDYLISNTNTTMVCATGNYSDRYILNPSSAYNCIAVNGFIDQHENITQNVLNDYSYNNGNGCFKPDVVAPSLNNGTSIATPYVAGMLALLYQYKPSLAASPEMTKAILMASCHKKCSTVLANDTISELSETMQDGLTDRQGAGIPDMYTMISIVSQHTYGSGRLNADNNYTRTINFIQPSYNASNINISMAYLQNDVPTSTVTGTLNDYNLAVTNYGLQNISSKTNSSTEMIYQPLTSSQKYAVRICRASGSDEEVRYGYAWSTDNEKYYNNKQEEGCFYIKNYNSSYYLTRNTSNNKADQGTYRGSLNDLWMLDYVSSSGAYSLKNANITSYGLGLGDSISTLNFYASENTSSVVNPVALIYNEEQGTYSFTQVIDGAIYALGINGKSTSSGAYANWSPYSPNNESQMWYLEAANYRSGDVNHDGNITNADITLIQSKIAQTVTLDNFQKYLADVNKDDTIDINDVVALQQIISTS